MPGKRSPSLRWVTYYCGNLLADVCANALAVNGAVFVGVSVGLDV